MYFLVILEKSPAAERRYICSAAQDSMKWMNGRKSRIERQVSLAYECKKQRQRANFDLMIFSTFTFLMSKLHCQVTGSTLKSMNDANRKVCM